MNISNILCHWNLITNQSHRFIMCTVVIAAVGVSKVPTESIPLQNSRFLRLVATQLENPVCLAITREPIAESRWILAFFKGISAKVNTIDYSRI